MGFVAGFRRGLEDDFGYEIAGKLVHCSHCGGSRFDEREGKINTTGMSFIGLDWANQSAKVLVCQECGHLEWFLGAD